MVYTPTLDRLNRIVKALALRGEVHFHPEMEDESRYTLFDHGSYVSLGRKAEQARATLRCLAKAQAA